MPIDFWIALWKWVLIAGVGLFAAMALLVTIGGAWDIRSLLRTLREQHAPPPAAPEDQGQSPS
jgi:hypothetical protein